MQRLSPRKRKQQFTDESPSKEEAAQERRFTRRGGRNWEVEQGKAQDQEELEEVEVDVGEEMKEDAEMHVMHHSMEEEEEVEVDDPVEEEVIEEFIDDFNIPLYPDEAETIHVSGKGMTGRRNYGRQDYSYHMPRLHDGDGLDQFGGEMMNRRKVFRGHATVAPPRPPVHLRTNETVHNQPRARLFPVAAMQRNPLNMHSRSMREAHYPSSSTSHMEMQKRRNELLDIYECLPADKQSSFLKYFGEAEVFGPRVVRPKVRRGMSPVNGRSASRMRHQTVEVPAHLARDGTELLISPQPDGRAKILAMVPVAEEEAANYQSGEGERKKGGRDGREERDKDDDTSDMPELEADKEALEGKRKSGEGRVGGSTEWETIDEDDVDVENVEESMIDDDKMHIDDNIPLLQSQVRRRQGLFYVPELDGYYTSAGNMDSRQYISPKMKGGLRLCESCNVYMRKSIYYHHQRTIREHGSCSAMTPKRFDCGVPTCDERLPTIERLCIHMSHEHGMPTEVQEVEFENEDEFQAFLVDLESKGGNFRMSRGNKCGKTGVVRYYRCNRVSNSGKFRAGGYSSNKEVGDEALDAEDAEDGGTGGSAVVGKRKFPLVRTEKICTAFYRKAEHIDGRISVRYCDYHLHDDIKVKLPEAAKDRIVEMLKKRLPMPVIVEVIKAESETFAPSGSEVERRIYGTTEKDVRNVYCTHLARKRKEEASGVGTVAEDDSDKLQLNETEQRFLSAFEKAEGKTVMDVAKGTKMTLERRRRRDGLRERLSNIGRFFKTEKFIECSDTQLSTLEELFSELAEICSFPRKAPAVETTQIVDMEVLPRVEDIEEEDEGEDDSAMPLLEPSLDESSRSETTTTIMSPPKKRGRPKRTVTEEKEKEKEERETRSTKAVKEEEEEETPLTPRTAIRTRGGRLTKPKVLPGQY